MIFITNISRYVIYLFISLDFSWIIIANDMCETHVEEYSEYTFVFEKFS